MNLIKENNRTIKNMDDVQGEFYKTNRYNWRENMKGYKEKVKKENTDKMKLKIKSFLKS